MSRTIAPLVVFAMIMAGCAGDQPPTGSSEVDQPGTPAQLVVVLDGDSIVVETAGIEKEVRLVGVNAPEREECHGDNAREALTTLLADAELFLVATGDDDQDRFGRLLRYVYADGKPVAEQLLATGDATVLQGDHDRDDAFVSLAEEAAVAGRGMWRPDACGPASGATLTITAVEYDPPGRDRDNNADEYVVIHNDGGDSVDLTDWTLRDESSQHRYRFATITLAPGAELRIRSGCGDDAGDDRYWCAGDAVWSNGGDSVLLLDMNGNVAARLLYRGDY